MIGRNFLIGRNISSLKLSYFLLLMDIRIGTEVMTPDASNQEDLIKMRCHLMLSLCATDQSDHAEGSL